LTAGLPVQVWAPLSKKVVLEFYDNPQYVYYFDTDKERALNNTFQGQIHIALEKFYIRAGGGMANVRRRLSPELNVNIREKADSVDGLALWQASRHTSLALIFQRTAYDYGDEEFGGTTIAGMLNRAEGLFDLVAYVQPNPRLRLFVDGQYGTYDFPDDLPSNRDAQSFGIFGGFEFTPREGELISAARIEGDLTLGYVRLDMESPSFKDASGISGTVNLSAVPFKRTTVRGVFSRGFEFSVFSGASYYLSTSYGGGISRQLSSRISLSYDLMFGSSDYPEFDSGDGIRPGYRYSTHSASLNFGLAPRLTLTLIGSLGRRTISQTDSARSRNFIGVNLIYGSPAGHVTVPVGAMSR